MRNAAPQALGCAFFNAMNSSHMSLLECGGYAVHGGELRAFNDASELKAWKPDVLWVTQLAPNAFKVHHGIRMDWLTAGHFLPTPLPFVAEELGVRSDESGSTEAACLAVGTILERVELRARNYGVTLSHNSQSLASAMAQVFGVIGAATAVASDVVHGALTSAAHLAFNPTPAAANDIQIRLPLQRIPHVNRVLGMGVPAGAWTEHPVDSKVEIQRLLAESQKPMLALVTMAKPEGLGADLLGKRSIKGNRTWIAHPELSVLNEVCSLNVEQLFVSEGYQPLSDAIAQPIPAGRLVDGCSVSSGLVMESLLAGIVGQGSPSANSVSTWVASRARVHAFKEAATLAKEGFKVTGWGLAHVYVSLKKGQLKDLRTFLATPDCGLLLPTLFAAGRSEPATRAAAAAMASAS